eukprot:Opistho-1_new@89858
MFALEFKSTVLKHRSATTTMGRRLAGSHCARCESDCTAGGTRKVVRCEGCLIVPYCSEACMRHDESHKRVCTGYLPATPPEALAAEVAKLAADGFEPGAPPTGLSVVRVGDCVVAGYAAHYPTCVRLRPTSEVPVVHGADQLD